MHQFSLILFHSRTIHLNIRTNQMLKSHTANNRSYFKRTSQNGRRSGRSYRTNSRRRSRRRSRTCRRRSRHGENFDRQNAGANHRRTVFAYPIYARPDAVGRDGNECFQYAEIGIFSASGTDFYRHFISRRNQPHAAENASRPARSDGRTPGDD